MNVCTDQSEVAIAELEELPPADEYVLVQCEGFRCLGFLDPHGKWRTASNRSELKQVRSWAPLNDSAHRTRL